jgi:L-fuculose-phosphate aldolase
MPREDKSIGKMARLGRMPAAPIIMKAPPRQSESAAREEICRVGLWMWERGFVCGREGNISLRLASGRVLCTPTEISKGAMKPADLAVLDEQGQQLSGRLPVTSEFRLHLQIFRTSPTVMAVVHAHPPCATAFAVARKRPPAGVQPEVEMLLGPIGLAAYRTPGTNAVAVGAAAHVKAGARAVLLSNHGAVTVGRTLLRAWWRLETLERYCQVLLLSAPLGGPRPLTAEQLAELLAMKRQMGLADPRNRQRE